MSEHPGRGGRAGEAYSGDYTLSKGKATALDRLSGLMDLINCRVDWAEGFAGITNRGNRHSRKNKCSCGRSGIVMLKKILITKAVDLFVNCDKMIGGQFEQGLAQMKTVVETANKK